MPTRRPNPSAVIRTQRLEIVDEAGELQAVIEATATGPRLQMLAGASEEPAARERFEVVAREDGATVSLYGREGDLGNPIVGLSAHDRDGAVTLDVVREYEHMDRPVPEAAVDLRSRPEGGLLQILDESLDPLLELPETRHTVAQRFRRRIVEAIESAIGEEDPGFTADDLLQAYYEASEMAQGEVRAIAASAWPDHAGNG